MTHARHRQHPPAADRPQRGDPAFWHDTVGFGWGVSIIGLTVVVRLADPAADVQAGALDAGAPAPPAGDEEDPGAVQGRQAAPAPGDDGALPGAQGQPARARACRCSFSSRSSSGSSTCCRTTCGRTSAGRRQALRRGRPGSAEFLFIPDMTDQATGGVLVVLIVLYVGTQLVSSHVCTVTAEPEQRRIMLALPVPLRPLRHQLRGRPDRLLDHHEHLDHRPAVPGQEALPETGSGRRVGEWQRERADREARARQTGGGVAAATAAVRRRRLRRERARRRSAPEGGARDG